MPQRAAHPALQHATGSGIKDRLILGADRRLDVQVLGRAGVPSIGRLGGGALGRGDLREQEHEGLGEPRLGAAAPVLACCR